MKRPKATYLFKFTLAYAIGSFLLAILINWILYNKVDLSNTGYFFTIIFFTAYLSGIYGRFFFTYFTKKPQQEITKKLIPAVLLFWLGVILIATIIIGITKYIWRYGTSLSFLELSDVLFALKSLFPWIFAISIIFFYELWRKGVYREQKLSEELLRFKYQILRDQVNPHFLFNSLNTLSSLINTSPEKADAFTNKLSDVYRYILLNESKSLVTLSDEIEFVKNYFDLQKIRDEGKIFLEIQIENPDRVLIVPVSLQVLVENAVKHNSATRKQPLLIRISRGKDYVKVVNNVQKKTNMGVSTKAGLINLKERIKLITGRDMMVTETREEFIVQVPIIER